MDPEDAPPAEDLPVRVLSCRTIGGQVYVRQADVVAALRQRAEECSQEGQAKIDAAPHDPDEVGLGIALKMVGSELRSRADELALAELAHQEEHPGDSVIHTPCPHCTAEVEYCPVCQLKMTD